MNGVNSDRLVEIVMRCLQAYGISAEPEDVAGFVSEALGEDRGDAPAPRVAAGPLTHSLSRASAANQAHFRRQLAKTLGR
jgi:hypothetical protein